MIQKGAKIAATDEEGYTPLHLAARRGFTDVAKEVLRWGADPHKLNTMEMTPLEIAIGQALSKEESTKERLADFNNFSVLMCKEMQPAK